MAESVSIADLFASLGVKVSAPQWSQAQDAIAKAESALRGLDRAADKVVAASKASAAAKRVADQQERQASQAARAIRGLERDEQRAADARIRNVRQVEVAQQRAAGRTRAKQQQAAEQHARELRKADEAFSASGAQIIGGITLGMAALGAYLGGKVVQEGVRLNATLEDSKNKVAGLMALAKHSDFNAELENAGVLMTNLEKAAAKLPGETSDYVNMLSLIAQPVSQAKLGLKELERLTISATSTALTMHIDPGQAARDIEGALNGVFNSRDRFTGPLLAARGFTGEEGRSRFNQLDAKKRASEVMAAFDAPQLKDMGAALGRSFTGQLSTAEDAWHRFERAITAKLFEALTVKLIKLNEWLDKNEGTIKEVAATIGNGLGLAFDFVMAIWNKAYNIFDRNREVLGRIADKVGGDLWTAFQLLVVVLDGALDQFDKLLHFFDHGFGKFLADALLMPGLLSNIATLLEKIGVNLNLIKQVGFGGLLTFIGSAVDLIAGDREDDTGGIDHVIGGDEPGIDHVVQGSGRRSRSEGLNETLSRRARLRSSAPSVAPSLPARGGPTALSVSVGDIHVNSPHADPVAVGDQVRKVFHEELGNTLRKTTDVYG